MDMLQLGKGDMSFRIARTRGCPKISKYLWILPCILPVVHVPILTHNNYTAYARGHLNKNLMTILLESGVSCSVLSKKYMSTSVLTTPGW